MESELIFLFINKIKNYLSQIHNYNFNNDNGNNSENIYSLFY